MHPANASLSAAHILAEKEAKLTSFIAEALLAPSADDSLTLVIRSTESPVARALVAALAVSPNPGQTVKVVVLDIDSVVEDHAPRTVLDMPTAQFRVLQDSRFDAAHEQLHLGHDCVWIGDCMRRDPAKRDAFEMYYASNASAALRVARSFSKLWDAAKPVVKALPRRQIEADVMIAGAATANDAPRTMIQN